MNAFVLLGATGDNAYRPAGVWTGLFEGWTTGLFESFPTDIHVQINQGHSVAEVEQKVMNVLDPFYESLSKDSAFVCKAANGDCDPKTFFALSEFNIWEGQGRYNASGQAANMSYLSKYDQIVSFMSIPPYAYGEWSSSMVQYWGGGQKNHIAVEKPFGSGQDSLKRAQDLFQEMTSSGLPEGNLHLTDHWLNFFMNTNLPNFQKILEKQLGITWDSKHIGEIIVTEFEERGFGGRGSFIDGLGQVRDMVQSHLFQVLSLATGQSDADSKLSFLNSLSLDHCDLRQFEGLLRSKHLKYHAEFADSTYCGVYATSSKSQWSGTNFFIRTGKSMDLNLYQVEVRQRNGPGKVIINTGIEEFPGYADIRVENWPVTNEEFEAPLPGFDSQETVTVKPSVDSDGNGFIIDYTNRNLYFPKPYSQILVALLSGKYGVRFNTWALCERSWEILTAGDTSVCLDPKPEDVKVYLPAFLCDMEAPEMCDTHKTVKDLYEVDYACNEKNNELHAEVDFYKAKCLSTLV